LEGRQLLATIAVTNLQDVGAGSLRQAILVANATPGHDTIDFDVAGTIRVGRSSLPRITDAVTIDGTSAPGFAGSPVVTVDFRRTWGLRFAAGSDGSTLKSLSLVRARDAGVTLDASRVTIDGNYIGVLADGRTPAGNGGDGIRINAGSRDNLIGRVNPVTGVTYFDADAVGIQPVSGWQGIRNADTAGQYLIAGTSNDNGLLYVGPIDGSGGTSYLVNVPGAASTSVYCAEDLPGDNLRLVGSYRTGGGQVLGFLFDGTTADLPSGGSFRTIAYPGATYNYVHSTMGGLAVGNADGPEGDAPVGTGHAFLYDIAKGTFPQDIVFPGSLSTTAYGIWHNGGTSYTIVGGYTNPGDPGPFAAGYMVDYDSATGQYTHWTSISSPGAGGQSFATHFEGISGPQAGYYTLAAGMTGPGSTSILKASVATVRRNPDGSFGPTYWVDLDYPGNVGMTTSDSVAGNQVVGIAAVSTGIIAYQATVNLEPQLSNVISANGGNGIGVYGSSGNRIAMNNIGTDATGTVGLGNRQNGIRLTKGASRNFLGGQVSDGNDPTAGVIVRPPQGNLISGNGQNGVLIDKGSTRNLLSGNFIGTTASGNSALGNRLDGVAIERADDNALIGCTFLDDPFIFYNVISGNGGNGLRITDSNNTTVHANFLGVGANNATVVPNAGNGLLVSGTSANTQIGGPIPLGNVISGNLRNGIEVRDRATGLVSFNTFAGTFAFGGAAPNGLDGILITSSGGNNLIRTCIVSGNLDNGIEIGGNATGVQVTEVAVGTNSSIQSAIPNGGSGIRISGNAHGNAIGGFQPSIEPEVVVSANRGYGIEVVDSAHDNVIVHTFIGTNAEDTADLGNTLGGIYLGPGTRSTTIGGVADVLRNKILNSLQGPGVAIRSSTGNALLGNQISGNAGDGVVVTGGSDNQIGAEDAGNLIASNGRDGVLVTDCGVAGTRVQANDIRGNAGNGVSLVNARHVLVGGDSSRVGNRILGNLGFGLFAAGACDGSVVRSNVILANARGDVDISQAQGITYVP
jgi:parallel beta-helix repeat protein